MTDFIDLWNTIIIVFFISFIFYLSPLFINIQFRKCQLGVNDLGMISGRDTTLDPFVFTF